MGKKYTAKVRKQFRNYGYGDAGASKTRRAFKKYHAVSGSSKQDTQNKKLAPFIKVGSVNSDRDTFYTDEFSPARIALSRLLSVDDLKKRGFGESLFSGMAPDQREAAIAGRDFIDLKDRIRRRKEKMAADCLMADG